MTMRLLTARRYPRRVTFAAHLDTTKMDPTDAAQPDPAWVYTQDYELGKGERRREGETAGAYSTRIGAWLNDIRADFRLRCLERLDVMVDATDPGIALAGEGQTF